MGQPKLYRGVEGSLYWGFYERFAPTRFDADEDAKANPDTLSDENGFNPWHGLAEDDEANLHAYYRAIARGALRKLTARERQVWKTVFIEKHTITEASTLLGISLSTIRSSLRRAGPKIKQEMDKELARGRTSTSAFE